jgi:hypothetical protein
MSFQEALRAVCRPLLPPLPLLLLELAVLQVSAILAYMCLPGCTWSEDQPFWMVCAAFSPEYPPPQISSRPSTTTAGCVIFLSWYLSLLRSARMVFKKSSSEKFVQWSASLQQGHLTYLGQGENKNQMVAADVDHPPQLLQGELEGLVRRYNQRTLDMVPVVSLHALADLGHAAIVFQAHESGII